LTALVSRPSASKRLKYVVTLRRSRVEGTQDNRPYIGLENIESSTGRLIGDPTASDQTALSSTGATESLSNTFEPGDVLFGKLRPYLAKAWVAAFPGRCTTELLVMQPVETESRFLRYVCLSHDFIDAVDASTFGSKMPRADWDFIGNMAVPVPRIPQQRAIADYLDRETVRLDALVAAKERVIKLLDEKRRALITHAVTRGLAPHAPLRNSGIPWLGKIPAHWVLDRAKFLFQQSSLPVRDEDEMVTCFRDGQVTLRRNRREEGFTNANLELGYQGIRSGQLVLHSMDAFAGAIGVSDSDGKCSPEYIICEPISDETVNHYYAYLVRTMALAGFIQASCPAVRERAPRIRFSDFGEMFLPRPSGDEQRAIIAHINLETEKLDALSFATERTIALLKERRAVLITAAVTGRINVVEADT
jgi:type I restriction enzyme, S subunit